MASGPRLSEVDEALLDGLIARMSLKEKVGQMFQINWKNLRPSSGAAAVVSAIMPTRISAMMFLRNDARPLNEKSSQTVATYFLGSVLGEGGGTPTPNEPHAWREQNDAMQAAAARTPTGVPMLIGNDSVHGQNNLKDSTLYPHHIGLGCMRDARGEPDEATVEQLAGMASRESYACGVNWMFTPCVAVPQDVRWGRTYEGFSEDTSVVAKLAAAEVRGVQNQPFPMAACVKHWVADGGTTYGTGTHLFFWSGAPIHVLDQGDAIMDETELRERHVAAYLPAIKEGALTIMATYSSWNGTKVHTSEYLITKVLKEELGFKGLVVSDYNAVQQCSSNFSEALVACINAGVDMVMTAGGLIGFARDVHWKKQVETLEAAVTKGLVPTSRIDDAVRRILRVKAALGLLDGLPDTRQPIAPHLRPSEAARDEMYAAVGGPAHRQLARLAVSKSCVLLRNERGTLPLDPKASGVVVAGAGANDLGMQCGGWSMVWQGFKGNHKTSGTTIWQGIQEVCPSSRLHGSGGAHGVAAEAPVAILVVGEPPYAEGAGDRKKVVLSSRDARTIRSFADGKHRMVVVLLCGRPIVVPSDVMSSIDSLVVAWLPGTEGGGVADVLFGRAAASGKLSYSWPRDETQSERKVRVKDPLFPLGFGLELPQVA
ncbi:hypothetical protein AB1Y20_003841 [Prymnesium parvum]|uniref:beta-glucosidase n=1 Tax=Prymnesium parvum TaxID=97485 RepID=A0AB34J8F0_PRYPA